MNSLTAKKPCSSYSAELTKNQLVECLLPLTIYEGFKESFFEIYYEVLKKYPYEKLKKAVKVVLKSYEYNTFPKPATIISALEALPDDDVIIYNNVSYPRKHCFCDKRGVWKPIQQFYDEYIGGEL